MQGDGPFTVFAPTDQAFVDAGIDLATFDTDEENETLFDILTYHVYSQDQLSSSQVTDGMTATMFNGDDAIFTITESGDILIGGATVTTADVVSSNGIIHVIDKVLLPPSEITEEDGDICYNTVTHTIVWSLLSKNAQHMLTMKTLTLGDRRSLVATTWSPM